MPKPTDLLSYQQTSTASDGLEITRIQELKTKETVRYMSGRP